MKNMRPTILLYTLMLSMALLFPNVQFINKIQQVFTPEAAFGNETRRGSGTLATDNNASESFSSEDTTVQSDDAAVHNAVGVTYYKSGMYKEAITAFREAIKIMPDYADAYRNLGVAYFSSGRSGDAIEAFKQGIKLEPGHIEAYYNLGIVYLKSGMYNEAQEAFGEAVRIKPGDAVSHYKLGVAYYESGMNEKATASFEEALKIKPDYAGAQYNIGIIHFKSGNKKGALHAFQETVRIKPGYTDAHYNLGILHFNSERYKEAIQAFQQAISIEPAYADAHYNLGLALYKSGMHNEAADAFKQVIAIKPDYPDAQYNLGLAYAEMNDEASVHEGPGAMKKPGPRRADHVYNKHADTVSIDSEDMKAGQKVTGKKIDNEGALLKKAEVEHNAEPPSIYTIQLGSFIKVKPAQKLFESVVQALNENELDNLRIEKIGKYYSVRLSKFKENAEAKQFLASVKSRIRDGIIMKAYFIEGRIERIYEP